MISLFLSGGRQSGAKVSGPYCQEPGGNAQCTFLFGSCLFLQVAV